MGTILQGQFSGSFLGEKYALCQKRVPVRRERKPGSGRKTPSTELNDLAGEGRGEETSRILHLPAVEMWDGGEEAWVKFHGGLSGGKIMMGPSWWGSSGRHEAEKKRNGRKEKFVIQGKKKPSRRPPTESKKRRVGPKTGGNWGKEKTRFYLRGTEGGTDQTGGGTKGASRGSSTTRGGGRRKSFGEGDGCKEWGGESGINALVCHVNEKALTGRGTVGKATHR